MDTPLLWSHRTPYAYCRIFPNKVLCVAANKRQFVISISDVKVWTTFYSFLFQEIMSLFVPTACWCCGRWSILVKVRITTHYVANTNIAMTSYDCQDISHHWQLNYMFKSLFMPSKQNIKTPHHHYPHGTTVIWGQFHVMTDIYVITYTHNILPNGLFLYHPYINLFYQTKPSLDWFVIRQQFYYLWFIPLYVWVSKITF